MHNFAYKVSMLLAPNTQNTHIKFHALSCDTPIEMKSLSKHCTAWASGDCQAPLNMCCPEMYHVLLQRVEIPETPFAEAELQGIPEGVDYPGDSQSLQASPSGEHLAMHLCQAPSETE